MREGVTGLDTGQHYVAPHALIYRHSDLQQPQDVAVITRTSVGAATADGVAGLHNSPTGHSDADNSGQLSVVSGSWGVETCGISGIWIQVSP